MHCTTTNNRACRNQKVKFFVADVWKALCVFINLQKYEYVEDVPKTKKVTILEVGEPVGKKNIETIIVNKKHVTILYRLNLF